MWAAVAAVVYCAVESRAEEGYACGGNCLHYYKLRKMLYNLNQLGYEVMLGLILQRFPSPTKVTNVILPSDDVLGRGGHPKLSTRHQIQPQKRGQFLGENCCNF